MPFVLKNKKTGEIAKTVYQTKRGATQGKNAWVKGQLQALYLQKDDYGVFLYQQDLGSGLFRNRRPITSKDIEVYNDKKQEFENEWEILQCEVQVIND